jgi:neutral ceramidase
MKNLRNLIVVSLISLMSSSLSAQVIKSGVLKVGASKADMSPQKELFAPDLKTGFAGVHDPVFVRTIVIDNGIDRAALVTLDITGIPEGDELVNLVAAELKIKPDNVILTATHDHNQIRIRDTKLADTPEAFKKYYEYIKASTLTSVKEAVAKLQPARIGYATGKAYINTNRDQKLGEGYHMGYNPEGPTDKTVSIVLFTSLSGEPIAIYYNYPVHAVVMFRATTKDGKPEVTGDLPGYTSRYVEDHFKGAVALYTMGAAGDQNPIFMATYNQDGPDVTDEGIGGYAIVDVLSRRLGEEVVRVTKSILNTSSEVKIWGKKTTITVPGRKRESPPVPGVPGSGYLAPANVPMIDGDPVTIPLHLLMINDVAMAGVSGEVFVEIGKHLKDQSLFDRTIMVTGMPSGAGYIPTDAAYLMPSEKAQTNRIKPGYVEPALINAFLQMMNEYVTGIKK